MKSFFHLGLVALLTLSASAASADIVIVGVDGSMSAGGTTQDVMISGTRLRPGGSATSVPQRWDATQPLGVVEGQFVGTFSGTDSTNSDWHVLIGDANGGLNSLGIPVGGATDAAYIEIFYSIDRDLTGTSHRISINGNSPSEAFVSDPGEIPSTAGAHSFVIDISQLSEAGSQIEFIRWDPWNSDRADNAGTNFTIDRIALGTELVDASATGTLGDVDLSGTVTFLDIAPFIDVLSGNEFQFEADCDQNGEVNFLDIAPFIDILSGT